MLAAGLTSAVTAPLAAAYAVTGVLGWDADLKSGRFRAVWCAVLVTGMIVAVTGIRPIRIIQFAQVANGILLPIVSVFLLRVMNGASLGAYRNRWASNVLGLIVVTVTLVLSVRSLWIVFGSG